MKRIPEAYVSFCWYCTVCMLLGSAGSYVLLEEGLNLFDYTQMVNLRTIFTLSYIIFLATVPLLARTPIQLIAVILTIFMTQYYQTILGRDFPAGVMSLMRWLPLLSLNAAAAIGILKTGCRVSAQEVVICSTIAIFCIVLLFVGPAPLPVRLANMYMLGVLLPTFYLYIVSVVRSDLRLVGTIIDALSMGFLILTTGTIAVFYAGMTVELAGHTGSGLHLRNVSDSNAIFVYLVLLWPLAYFRISRTPMLGMFFCALFAFTLFISFSRTAVLVTMPILGLSVLALARSSKWKVLVSVGLLLVLVISIVPAEDIATFTEYWVQRFNFHEIFGDTTITEHLTDLMGLEGQAMRDRNSLQVNAIQLFLRAPLTGLGWGSYLMLSERGFPSAHGMIFDWLAETGLVGTSILVTLEVIVLSNLIHLFKSGSVPRINCAIIGICFIIWNITANFFGGNLQIACEQGWIVNAINGFILVFYLDREFLTFAAQSGSHQAFLREWGADGRASIREFSPRPRAISTYGS